MFSHHPWLTNDCSVLYPLMNCSEKATLVKKTLIAMLRGPQIKRQLQTIKLIFEKLLFLFCYKRDERS